MFGDGIEFGGLNSEQAEPLGRLDHPQSAVSGVPHVFLMCLSCVSYILGSIQVFRWNRGEAALTMS